MGKPQYQKTLSKLDEYRPKIQNAMQAVFTASAKAGAAFEKAKKDPESIQGEWYEPGGFATVIKGPLADSALVLWQQTRAFRKLLYDWEKETGDFDGEVMDAYFKTRKGKDDKATKDAKDAFDTVREYLQAVRGEVKTSRNLAESIEMTIEAYKQFENAVIASRQK